MIKFTREQTEKWLGTLDKRASSAGVFCETADGRLLVVQANYKRLWTIPGGVIDPGEMPLDAAVRETFEETGITLDKRTIEFSHIAVRESVVTVTYQFVFRAGITDEQIAGIKLQASEIDEYTLVSREQVLANESNYGLAICNWAHDVNGYVEDYFALEPEAESEDISEAIS